MNFRFAAWLLAVCASASFGQGIMTTFAGTDWLFPGDGRPALQAPIGGLFSLDVVTDRNGNYYICDADNDVVLRVGSDGIVNVVAGNGLGGFSGDGGFAVNARLDTPLGIAVDSTGNLYIAEFGSHVRKVTPDGIITTIAGTGVEGYTGDHGPALSAQLNEPRGLAVDSAGNLYIADTGNHVVRRVTPDGTITTIAGTGQAGSSGDKGPATSAVLNFPVRLALDTAGSLYIADTYGDFTSGRIRRVTNGTIDTVAGGGIDFSEGAIATSAPMIPLAVGVDASRNIYIVDQAFAGVRKVDSTTGKINTIAGNGSLGFAGDGGPALKASFNFVASGIAVDSSGNILVADDQNRRVREITADAKIQTIAGNGLYRFSGNGGPATSATLYLPVSVIADASGNVFLTEQGQNRVRRVAPDGTISVYAGTGQLGFSGDNGPAANATLSLPSYLAIRRTDGNLYVADTINQAIRKIDKNGTITSYVLTGQTPFGSDARAHSTPFGIDFDDADELLIADKGTNRLLFVNPTATQGGVFAGTGEAGFAGDNEDKAASAKLNKPVGLAYHSGPGFPAGVYFCDSGNNRVRRVTVSGLTITTVAGNGAADYKGDGGQARNASLNNPQGLTFDKNGNLYIADEGNFVIRKVTPDGTITTVAGSPNATRFGDGDIATRAALLGPADVSFDAAGNMLIAEFGGDHIREVLSALPSFQISTNSIAFTAPAGGNAVTQNADIVGSIPGIPYTAAAPAASPWLSVSPASGFMPATLQITADPSKLSPGPNQATITISAPNARPGTQSINVALTVTAPGQPSLNVNPTSLAFSFLQQSAARSRALTLSNAGGGSLNVNIATSTTTGQKWLSVSTGTASLTAFGSATLNLTADPSGLSTGTYSGTVTVSSVNPAQSVTVPVTMTVSAVQQSILIPQTGLTFFAVQGGGPTLPQFFNILNTGTGQMRWTAKASTLSGGSWLTAFPTAGVSDAASPLVPAIRLDVDPQGLNAGTYAGTVQVTAPGADNTPQSVSVFLNVQPPGSKLGAIVQPAAMIFAAAAGGESPSSQTLLVQSLSTAPVTFHSASVTADGKNWLTTVPRDGTVTAAQPVRIVVQPITTDLAPGIYRASLTFSFSDGSTRNVTIVLVVVATGGGRTSSVSLSQAQGACTPTTLAPVFTVFSDGFMVPAGFPGQVAVKVIDDCANLMTTGSVTAKFNNGDPDIKLDSLKDGNWSQTWTPQHNTAAVTITANAVSDQGLAGQVQIKGGFLTLDTPPLIGTGAVVNAASFALQAPLAPGSLVTIFGSKMAGTPASAQMLPLPLELSGSSLILAGVQIPLTYASDGQINAQIPYETAENVLQQQIVLLRGTIRSAPQPLTVAPAAPGIFTKDSSGKGQGIIFGVDASGAQILADSARPVKAGDVIVIYCTGLGRVNPPVPTGSPAPGPPNLAQVVNPLSITVGGVASGYSFAGLTPGFVGLYQVNATIPQGVTPGNQVPVVLTVAGQPSLPVTIAVQ